MVSNTTITRTANLATISGSRETPMRLIGLSTLKQICAKWYTTVKQVSDKSHAREVYAHLCADLKWYKKREGYTTYFVDWYPGSYTIVLGNKEFVKLSQTTPRVDTRSHYVYWYPNPYIRRRNNSTSSFTQVRQALRCGLLVWLLENDK